MNIQMLKQKVNDLNASFSDKEVSWLLDNIGNPDNVIRDNLVCNIFGNGFFEEKFTKQQVRFLIDQISKRNLLFYCIKESGKTTLTRSFTCLLWDLIIRTNDNKDSRYYQILDKDEEQQVFKNLIYYLKSEHEFTGFSKEYGWVHAIAHCSDALADSMLNKDFDQEMVEKFLLAVREMLNNIDKRFIDGEEYRLADVFINGFKVNKISSSSFINWIKSITFDPYSGDLLEYYKFNNLKSMLEDIYVKLNSYSLLDSNLKKIVEKDFISKY
ncbi:MAG: Hypothetical protein LKU_00865 [Lactobacillus kefiranofaciens]|uniref:DUF2785 domain-containing protein n=2 Tax=Lactobacillus kefiranofaciens TaxID=267818 RepID=A0AAX3UFY0_9LACO|nr:DUF2785 domain-containing protein [Lactobacillus kefiranofaciens]QFQ67631.1 DUF2785 domain-containing protein [Lactobacillus kefiranofaciens subsp. kefiranofaciens]WGO86616.1 DUF2785 domain-containing protein [Lactobacillus kefiranofaciens]WQH36065.1 DUF2785 domain-containing protein [Lactobacillus kefiranofaciens]SDA37040.1 Protein of unknown function [Lactobacillus kefiranofaciens]